MTTVDLDAGEFARGLAQRILALVQDLLPAGQREGHEYKVGSVAGEAGRSLSICLSGTRAGIWADFSGDMRGDALDLVAAVLYGGDKRSAIAWALRWLGWSSDAAPQTRRLSPRPIDTSGTASAEDEDRKRWARKIWLAAAPALKGTPAAEYLLGRGVDLGRLGRQPRALRFHPALYNGESRREWPALVAAICDDTGEHVATHRTWLARQDGVWGKAPLRDARKSIGTVSGGSIRLWRGASGKSLANALAGEAAAIAEGIETALSVAIACPEMRVLCCVSLANMANLALPPAITRIYLCADNDPNNDQAARAVRRAAMRYQAQDRLVHIAMPATPGADWNDVLQGEGA
jgi:hypothetical protein